jgi:hypothetical protein
MCIERRASHKCANAESYKRLLLHHPISSSPHRTLNRIYNQRSKQHNTAAMKTMHLPQGVAFAAGFCAMLVSIDANLIMCAG